MIQYIFYRCMLILVKLQLLYVFMYEWLFSLLAIQLATFIYMRMQVDNFSNFSP